MRRGPRPLAGAAAAGAGEMRRRTLRRLAYLAAVDLAAWLIYRVMVR